MTRFIECCLQSSYDLYLNELVIFSCIPTDFQQKIDHFEIIVSSIIQYLCDDWRIDHDASHRHRDNQCVVSRRSKLDFLSANSECLSASLVRLLYWQSFDGLKVTETTGNLSRSVSDWMCDLNDFERVDDEDEIQRFRNLVVGVLESKLKSSNSTLIKISRFHAILTIGICNDIADNDDSSENRFSSTILIRYGSRISFRSTFVSSSCILWMNPMMIFDPCPSIAYDFFRRA